MYYTRLSRVTADSAWLSKQLETDPVALEPSKQPKEVSTLIQTLGFKLIQDSGLQIAETLPEGGTSLYHLRFSTDE